MSHRAAKLIPLIDARGTPGPECALPALDRFARWSPLALGRRLRLVFFLSIAGVIASAGIQAQTKPLRQVVVLFGEGASSPTIRNAKAVIDDALRDTPYNLVSYPEYIDTIFYPDPASLKFFEDFYTRKFKDRQPDLLIAVGPIPPSFLEGLHKDAFPGVPVVVCLMDSSSVRQLDFNFTGVEAVTAPAETLRAALRLEPKTKHVVVVGGADPLDKSRMDFAREQLSPFASQVDISYLAELAMPDLLGRLHQLPADSLVLLTSVRRDGTGKPFFSTESAPMIAAAANAPVFTLFDNQMGRGEVGGYVTDYSRQARAAANMALQILGGKTPLDVPRVTGSLTYVFDRQALDHWGLNARDLPPGSILINRPPSPWNSYRSYAIGAMAVISLEALLIGGLLWNRARRKRAEERFRAIFENSDSGIALVNMRGQIVACNPALCRTLGYSEAELCRLTLTDITHPDDDRKTMEYLSELFAGRRNKYQIEKRHITKDGRTIWVNVKVSTLHGPGSSPRYCIGILDDITDRKAAETALRESEALFRSYFELPMIGCTIVTPGKPGIIANERLLQMLGYSLDELEKALWSQITFPEDRDSSVRLYNRLLAGEIERYSLEKRYRRKDGSTVWAEIAVSCVRNEDGSVAQVCGCFQDITDRKAAESALRESEGRLRSYFELPLVGCSIVTPGKVGVQANKRLSDILGYSQEELARMSWTQMTHPDDLDESVRLYEQLLAGEIEQYTLEKRYRRKDGKTIWVEVAIGCVRNGDGSVAQVCGYAQEVTARRAADSAVRESEARFRSFFELPLAGCFLMIPGQVGISANKRLSEYLGYSEEELSQMSWAQILHPEELDASLRDWRRLLANEIDQYSGPKRYLRKDGSINWAEIAISCLRDENGAAVQVCGLFQDITQRKHAEEALRKAEEDYRTIFEQSVSGIICVTTEGKILAINPAAARIAGYDSPAEVMAANVNTHALWRDPQKRLALIELLERSEVIHGFEFEIKRRDGTFIWVSAGGRKITGSDGETTYYEAFIEEITVRKHLEQQLLQAQKMEAIGRLAGGVAHDFNNILGIITGYTDLILTDSEVSERVSQYVTEIRDASHRAADVTRQLLAFSRKQVLQAQVLDLNAAVREAVTMVGRILGEDVELVTSLAPDTGPVEIDPTGLHRIILNLAANARDAMPNGGKLTIETARITLDEVFEPGRHRIPAGDYSMLAISDTGDGMDAETQKHIFEPFFTTKEIGNGTGMGLATVYGIVQQSSGHILVYSEPGQGAMFKIYLPRVASTRAILRKRPQPATPRGNETILLVEDNPHLRQITAKLLRGLGYVVVEAQEASEAIAIAGTLSEPPDLLVTDVVMPGMNGQELADTLAARYPAMKVLFMSGYTDTIIADRIASQRAVFLQKPFSRSDLAARLREALAKPIKSPA